jgi:surfactin synthase thioesterase subunit
MILPVTLFCFPCAGSSAEASYLRWRKKLPSLLQIAPVELPGRGSLFEERRHRNFTSLAELLAGQLANRVHHPYVLLGHSLGALLALDMAHRLRDLRRPSPLALIVICCAAPTRRDDARFADPMSDEELVAELRRLHGTPEEVLSDPDLRRLTLDNLAADFSVCASFRVRARAPLPLPIIAYGGDQDDVRRDDLMAWESETSGLFDLEMFKGNHFFMRDEEEAFISSLVKKLTGIAVPRITRASHGEKAASSVTRQ